MERLRNLQVEDDYVEVESSAEKGSYGTLLRESEGLSISVLESWQHSVLSDPKNKSAYSGDQH